MENNPFRSNPSTKVEDWGKTKYKPTNLSGAGKKPFQKRDKTFNRNKKFCNRKGNNFGNKETFKFNEVANDAKPDNATPWNKYKDEIIYKQREEEHAALQSNMTSIEAGMALRQREINYRRSLIEQKRHEPTEWEDFGEERGDKNETKSSKFTKADKSDMNRKHNADTKFNKQSKKKFKNESTSKPKAYTKEFISKELLDNFDSKKLSYTQNDKLRCAITKTAALAAGSSLERVVKAMKKKAMKNSNKK